MVPGLEQTKINLRLAMMETERISRWNELRSAAIIDRYLGLQKGQKARHVGSAELLDIHVFRGDQLIGMGEVKSDIDCQIAASADAQSKHDAYVVDLPKGSGQWGVSFRPAANLKNLKVGLSEVIKIAKELGLTFVAPEQLWHESHITFRTLIERLGIAHFWNEPGSLLDRALLLREPWGGLVPNQCPPLQNWVSEILMSYKSRKSIEILGGAVELEQRHFVICIESNSPLPIRLYLQNHALELPIETLELPSWITDLWIIVPRGFQERDIAWRYSSVDSWELFTTEGFLDF